MTKVALISGDSSLTGAPSHIFRLAKGLRKKGFDILVIAPPGPLIRRCQNIRLKAREVLMGNVFDRQADHKIREILQEFSPEIAHFHGTRGGWLGRLAARKLPKIKKVYTEHLWTKDFHLSNRGWEQFQLRGLKFLDRWTDKTVAVSKAVKDFLVKRGFKRKKIVVVPDGINPEFLKINKIKKPKEVPLVIGSVGSLNQVKNYRNTILAVAKAKELAPEINFHYQIIGEGPLEKNLQALVKKKGLEKTVHFMGRVESVSERLRHFSIFINTSFSESFGLAVGEAMAVGLPVIASNIESLRELVSEKAGLFINPKKIDEVALAIVKLLKDEKLRESFGRNAKKRIEKHFSEEKMIKKTMKVYKELLNE